VGEQVAVAVADDEGRPLASRFPDQAAALAAGAAGSVAVVALADLITYASAHAPHRKQQTFCLFVLVRILPPFDDGVLPEVSLSYGL
jgi:hypothetical protein